MSRGPLPPCVSVCIDCGHEIDDYWHQPMGMISDSRSCMRGWGRCIKCIKCTPRFSLPLLRCIGCTTSRYNESQLLLEEGVMTSCTSRTWVHCFLCSGFYDEAEFQKTASARWVQHDAIRKAVLNGGLVSRSDTLAADGNAQLEQLCKAMLVLERLFPGAPQWNLRSLTFKRREAAAMALATALDPESEECRMAASHTRQQYFEKLHAAAANPTYRASRDRVAIESSEAAYLTEVAEGLTVSVFVRCVACRFMGMNHHWNSNVDFEHFRCPLCGACNSPTGNATAQQVISMTDPNSGLAFCFPWPRKGQGKLTELNKLVKVKEDEMAKLKEDLSVLFSGIPTGTDLQDCQQKPVGIDLEGFVQKSVVDLSDFLAKVTIPSVFKPLDCYREVAMYNIWPELIGLLANVLAGAKVLGSRKIWPDFFGSLIVRS